MSPSVRVVGGGISGLASACHLAKAGLSVSLYEKNETLGGRARCFEASGFRFDMGPSWYWMPDVFDTFFATFDKRVEDYYQLVQLDPGFRMFFGRDDFLDIPADFTELKTVFEKLEPGAGQKLDEFMADAAYKYKVGMQDLVYRPGLSPWEFLDWRVLRGVFKLNLLTPFDQFVKRYFKNERLRQIMEFPVLFLGAAPAQTPALYSLMNFAGLKQGTFYPKGGMYEIIKALQSLATELGVTLHTDAEVENIVTEGSKVTHLRIDNEDIAGDHFISSADYHHTDQVLLSPSDRNYDQRYWDTRTMAPSSLLFYLGLNKKIEGLSHHNLFFDADLDKHAAEIYEQPKWPTAPLFYACCPSKTDPSVAPESQENLFVLMPIAAGLADTKELRDTYFTMLLNRLEGVIGTDIRSSIVYQRSYCVKDFIKDYHAFKGNAYGLANTLRQTAILKPKLKNQNVKNLYYCGHLTVPGPGVPPALVSGKIVADQIISKIK